MSLPEDPSEHSMPGSSTIFEAELAVEAQTPPSLPALSPTSQDDDGLHGDEVPMSPPAQQWHFLTVARDLSTLTEEIVLRSPRETRRLLVHPGIEYPAQIDTDSPSPLAYYASTRRRSPHILRIFPDLTSSPRFATSSSVPTSVDADSDWLLTENEDGARTPSSASSLSSVGLLSRGSTLHAQGHGHSPPVHSSEPDREPTERDVSAGGTYSSSPASPDAAVQSEGAALDVPLHSEADVASANDGGSFIDSDGDTGYLDRWLRSSVPSTRRVISAPACDGGPAEDPEPEPTVSRRRVPVEDAPSSVDELEYLDEPTPTPPLPASAPSVVASSSSRTSPTSTPAHAILPAATLDHDLGSLASIASIASSPSSSPPTTTIPAPAELSPLAFSIELLLPSEHSAPALGLNWHLAGAWARAQSDDGNPASIADHDAAAATEDADGGEDDVNASIDAAGRVAESPAGEYRPLHEDTIDETAGVDDIAHDTSPPQSERVLRLVYVGEDEVITPGSELVYEVERDDDADDPSSRGTLHSTSVAQSASDILDETRLSPTSPVLPELDESPSLTDAILSLPLLPRMFLKTTRSSSPHPDDGRVTHVATLPRLAQPQRPSSRPFIEQPPPSLRVSFPSSTFDDLLAFPNNASARAAAPARTRARTISARNRDRNREGASVLWTPRQEVNLPRTRRNTISTATPTERGARPTQRRVRFASHLPLPREVPPLRLGARGPLLVHPSEELVSLYGFCAFQNLDDCIL
ncbi:hypothetical protein MKEN_00215500 [Mycena kentingensis (nom. inval.)]|nr:hypothetical protein MKEN_00215500 [Mycena kentingensis (nom. inval.)]